ncbi:MAG TPA: Rv3235 family protein [Streptosporangiales bacterium]
MTTTTVSQLRRLPTPSSEPPFDDEREFRHAAGTPGVTWLQGALALAPPVAVPDDPPPHALPRRTPLRLVPDLPDDEDVAHEVPCDDLDPDPACYPVPPVHHPWVGRLTQALLEVLAGERPHTQLLPWTSDRVFRAVTRRVTVAARMRSTVVDLTRRPRLQLGSIRVTEPAVGVAEVCAVVRRGERCQAVALRLEAWRGRWRCTAFELA